jgi:hypothetical protein
VLNGEVVTLTAYEGRDVAVDDARSFASRVAATGLLPSTCVLDVGPIHGSTVAIRSLPRAASPPRAQAERARD